MNWCLTKRNKKVFLNDSALLLNPVQSFPWYYLHIHRETILFTHLFFITHAALQNLVALSVIFLYFFSAIIFATTKSSNGSGYSFASYRSLVSNDDEKGGNSCSAENVPVNLS